MVRFRKEFFSAREIVEFFVFVAGEVLGCNAQIQLEKRKFG